jgi:hypothetical protein
MTKYFVQLYGEIDDLCNSRILEELNYYMYDVRNKNEMLFYFTKEQTIFVVTSDDTTWSFEKLQAVCRTALRDNCFVILKMDTYNGYMSVWNTLNEESKKFFEDPKTVRAAVNRGNKLTRLLSRIKRAVKSKETN